MTRKAMPCGTAFLVIGECGFYYTSWPWRKVLAMMGVV